MTATIPRMVLQELRSRQARNQDPIVKPSILQRVFPQAGNGLFATRNYSKNDIIAVYGGVIKDPRFVQRRTHLRALALSATDKRAIDGLMHPSMWRILYDDDENLYKVALSNNGFSNQKSAKKALKDTFTGAIPYAVQQKIARLAPRLVQNAHMVFSSNRSSYKHNRNSSLCESRYLGVPNSEITFLVAKKPIAAGEEIFNTYNMRNPQFR